MDISRIPGSFREELERVRFSETETCLLKYTNGSYNKNHSRDVNNFLIIFITFYRWEFKIHNLRGHNLLTRRILYGLSEIRQVSWLSLPCAPSLELVPSDSMFCNSRVLPDTPRNPIFILAFVKVEQIHA